MSQMPGLFVFGPFSSSPIKQLMLQIFQRACRSAYLERFVVYSHILFSLLLSAVIGTRRGTHCQWEHGTLYWSWREIGSHCLKMNPLIICVCKGQMHRCFLSGVSQPCVTRGLIYQKLNKKERLGLNMFHANHLWYISMASFDAMHKASLHNFRKNECIRTS